MEEGKTTEIITAHPLWKYQKIIVAGGWGNKDPLFGKKCVKSF